MTDDEVKRRKEAREAAATAAELLLGEAGRLDGAAQAWYWEWIRKLVPQSVTPAIGLEPFTDHQARMWGRQRMQFGKYEGTPIDEVPLSYLQKLAEPNDFTRCLRRYLASQRVAVEAEMAEQNREDF